VQNLPLVARKKFMGLPMVTYSSQDFLAES
jgi:hypothetical protein